MEGLRSYSPDLCLVVASLFLLFLEAFNLGKQQTKKITDFLIVLFFLFLAAFFLVANDALDFSLLPQTEYFFFFNVLKITPWIILGKWAILLAIFLLNLLAYTLPSSFLRREFLILTLLISVAGMCVLSANHLLVFYLALETISIISYGLTALHRQEERSSEAAVKYVIYGGVSSALMLFGMAHLYGLSEGSLFFSDLLKFFSHYSSFSSSFSVALLISLALIFVGFFFKLSLVPFHFWAPDVYEGAPVSVVALLATVPKIAFFGALYGLFSLLPKDWMGTHFLATFVSLAGLITMTWGNMAAIGQTSLKRLFAYSSIAHAGTISMVFLAVTSSVSLSSLYPPLFFYLFFYVPMSIIPFFYIQQLDSHYKSDHLELLSGFIKCYPGVSISFILVLLSLIGLPPMAGFVAKFQIFSLLLNSSFYTAAFIMALNSLISIAYYFKVIRVLSLSSSVASPEDRISTFSYKLENFPTVIMGGLAILLIVLGIFWNTLFHYLSQYSGA